MSAQHTPGPWGATNAHTGPTFWRVEPFSADYLNDGWVIANEIHGPDGEANARLIAASPDLYEALASLIADLGPGGYLLPGGAIKTARARAALAKAEGRS